MGELIREIPENLRPYEKAKTMGLNALDDAELLALVLRTGPFKEGVLSLSRRILNGAGGSIRALKDYTKEELTAFPGIGEVKALQLMAILELSVRLSRSDYEKADLSSPEKCANLFMEEMLLCDQEVLKAVYLNSKNRLIKSQDISIGSVNRSMVPVREILLNAFRCRAVHMILVHNHPSGDPEPSNADILATRQVFEAGKLVGIPLLDHIVTGDHCYISFRELGLIPSD